MPTRYSVHPEFGLVAFHYDGVINADDIVALFTRYRQSQVFNPAFDHLIDMSETERLDVDFAQVQRIVARLAGILVARPKSAKSGLYAPGDVQFGVGRMYQSLAEQRMPFTLQVCRTRAEVFDFLALAPQTGNQVMDALAAEQKARRRA